jgi:hypothetical protein
MNEPDLIELAMRVAQQTATTNETQPGTTPAHRAETSRVEEIEVQPVFPNIGLPNNNHPKERKTHEELAAMILADLSEIDGCPTNGVKVTAYGSNPWNAWLSFGVAAGTVPNKAELQEFFDIVTERHKRLYTVSP